MEINKKMNDFMELWLRVYKDDKDVLLFYCKKILKGDNDFAILYDQDIAMAALSMPKIKFNYKGTVVPASMVTSLVVNPDYRHSNYELDLNFFTSNSLYQQGVAIECGYMISPRLRNLYKRRWHSLVCESRQIVHAERPTKTEASTSLFTIEKTKRNIVKEYTELTSRLYNNYIIYPSETFDYLALESDFFLARDSEGTIRGIAFRLHYTDNN